MSGVGAFPRSPGVRRFCRHDGCDVAPCSCPAQSVARRVCRLLVPVSGAVAHVAGGGPLCDAGRTRWCIGCVLVSLWRRFWSLLRRVRHPQQRSRCRREVGGTRGRPRVAAAARRQTRTDVAVGKTVAASASPGGGGALLPPPAEHPTPAPPSAIPYNLAGIAIWHGAGVPGLHLGSDQLPAFR